MKDFLYRLAYRFQSFMYGRNGNDQLGYFTLIVYFIITLIKGNKDNLVISILQLLLMFVYIFRAFSKKLSQRRNENQAFLRMYQPVIKWFRKKFKRAKKMKEYKYFKCPNCHSELRVPRGKGKITVTCPKCHTSFDKKS